MECFDVLKNNIINYLTYNTIKYEIFHKSNFITLYLTDFNENIQFVLNKNGWDMLISSPYIITEDKLFNEIFESLKNITYNINNMFFPLNKDQEYKIFSEKEKFIKILNHNTYKNLINSIKEEKYNIKVKLNKYKNLNPEFEISYNLSNDIWMFKSNDMIENANIIDLYFDLFQNINNKINDFNNERNELFI